jgi:hypothetical protein
MFPATPRLFLVLSTCKSERENSQSGTAEVLVELRFQTAEGYLESAGGRKLRIFVWWQGNQALEESTARGHSLPPMTLSRAGKAVRGADPVSLGSPG